MKQVQMRKWSLIVFSLIVLSACKDNNGCMPIKPEDEEPAMQAYAAANGITWTKHSSGLYYQIITQGSGPTPGMSSKIWVTYVGKHMNGTTFDQATIPTNFAVNGQATPLGQLIEGWKIGLPLIQKGGRIKLIVPSSLGYGCVTTDGAMPANSVLYFDIQLIDVQ